MRVIVPALVLLAVLTASSEARADPVSQVWAAVHDARVASTAVGSERAALAAPNDEAGDSFHRFVDHAAALEVQLALRLYDLGEDARATDALRRYQLLSADAPHAQFLASLMIGEMLHRNGDHRSAATELERAAKSAANPRDQAYAYLMTLQQLCAGLSYWVECSMRLNALAETPQDSETAQLIAYELAYTDVVLRQRVDPNLPQTFDNQRLRQQAVGLLERDAAFREIRRKRPGVAGTLSAVLPGAGQLYNGRPVDALLAFVVNGGFGVGTALAFVEAGSIPLGVVLAVFTAGFYTGNIVNAVVDARRITADRYLEFFDELEADYWPRVSFVIDDDTVMFTYGFDWPGQSPADHGQ